MRGWPVGNIYTGDGTVAGSTGAVQWARGFGSSQSDRGYAIAVDGNRYTVTTGYFSDVANFDITNLTTSGSLDIFLATFWP